MQVTHVRDHVTHAVIGGKQTIDFGISDNAEFFNILSSTLYRDQMLAVVREVLCNAWDAHIDAGCTDVPIEVTFFDGKIIVRDFGKGIHSNDIGPIYGTYGGSTKKNDGTQTGGFGLGCKAPFAYTDHFEVISHHQGTMTVYAMSKSSAEVSGKPGITPIMSAPTTSSGLQVSIKIKNNSDNARFRTLVNTIAYRGDILVKCDGDLIDTINFTDETNFMILTELNLNSVICIRYGNVIYPVDHHNSIDMNYDKVVKIVQKISTRYGHNHSIVFQALPHSISVTPSRESLSMQDHTCKALNNLFVSFIDEFERKFDYECSQYNINIFNDMTLSTNDVLSRRANIIGKTEESNQKCMRTIKDMASKYLEKNYPDNFQFRKQDIKLRLNYLLKRDEVNRGMVSTFVKELDEVDEKELLKRNRFSNEGNRYTGWFHKRILRPVAKKIAADPSVSIKQLYVCDSRADNHKGSNRHYSDSRNQIIPVSKAEFRNVIDTMPYIRNIIVLAHSRIRLSNEAMISNDTDDITVSLGSGFLVYIVPRKKDDLDNARIFFKKIGMTILDYTLQEEEIRKETVVREIKPRRKGIPTMRSVYHASSKSLSLYRYKDANVELITDPKFILKVNIRKNEMNSIDGFKSYNSEMFFCKYGHLGGLVSTESQFNTYTINKGIPTFQDYVAQDIINYVSQSATIKEYWAFNPSRLCDLNLENGFSDTNKVIRYVFQEEYLKKQYSFIDNRTEEDILYLRMMDSLLNNFRYFDLRDSLIEMIEMLDRISIDKTALEFVEKLNANVIINFIDVSGVERASNIATDPVVKQKILDTFLTLINS